MSDVALLPVQPIPGWLQKAKTLIKRNNLAPWNRVRPRGSLFGGPHHKWRLRLYPPSLDFKQRKGRQGQLGAEDALCRPL